MSVLVTGAAGFIGFHVGQALLARGDAVVGVDNLNPYYDVALKRARLAELAPLAGFTFHEADISDRAAIAAIVGRHPEIDRVVHLAAQAGVRHSLENPYAYIEANVMGQVVMLEAVRRLPRVASFVYASSSSVYGGNTKQPSSVDDRVDTPVSLYAATKRADELITHAYCHLYGIPATGLRFFTVYGPWGRPDMAMFLFAKAIVDGTPIRLFNHGDMRRDFTYIDDVSEAVVRLIDRPPRGNPNWSGQKPDPATSAAPWKIYNIGNNNPQDLMHVVSLLEKEFCRTALKEMLPMQPGDVLATYADVEDLAREVGFRPATKIEEGIARFAKWYRDYHNL